VTQVSATSIDRFEQIKQIFAREQIEKPIARRFGDIPVSYEAITPEWMTAILCRDAPGAEVIEVRLGPPDTGTSNRRRIHVEYNQAGQDAGLPASVFCKATHDLANRILLSTAGTKSEVRFYNEIRPTLDIDAPDALFAAYDPESWASILVLRDIANEVTFCSHETPMTEELARSQMDLLGKMHGTFYQSPKFAHEFSDMIVFRNRFHLLCERNGFEKCCVDGFLASEEFVPARLFAREAEIWPATMRAVDRHKGLPETLTHNDVHLKNWYIRGNALGLGDWQVSCRGHWSRDLAYTIGAALQPDQRRAMERDLIAYYLDRLHAAGGPKVAFAEAWDHYREQMLSALAWWTMTLTPAKDMPDMQPFDTTREFIHRLAVAIDDLDSLDMAD
jgi:thiamine kinase-like enzyme